MMRTLFRTASATVGVFVLLGYGITARVDYSIRKAATVYNSVLLHETLKNDAPFVPKDSTAVERAYLIKDSLLWPFVPMPKPTRSAARLHTFHLDNEIWTLKGSRLIRGHEMVYDFRPAMERSKS